MQYTDHYNLNLPEGTDIVNPLVQDNPNYTAIDTALYANKLRVIGGASEVKTGTNHAITRSDSDIDIIRFTATSDWDAGDTMTIDGVSVSVFLPDGSAPQDDAYIINSEVLIILNGSRVTLYSNSIDLSAINTKLDNLDYYDANPVAVSSGFSVRRLPGYLVNISLTDYADAVTANVAKNTGRSVPAGYIPAHVGIVNSDIVDASAMVAASPRAIINTDGSITIAGCNTGGIGYAIYGIYSLK